MKEPAARRRVLVLEDEALIAMSLVEQVESLGFESVGPVRHLTEAIRLAKSEPLDAAILDVVIGNGVSYFVAELLAARGIPFAFISGIDRVALGSRWMTRPFLSKPFGFETLRALLKDILP